MWISYIVLWPLSQFLLIFKSRQNYSKSEDINRLKQSDKKQLIELFNLLPGPQSHVMTFFDLTRPYYNTVCIFVHLQNENET